MSDEELDPAQLLPETMFSNVIVDVAQPMKVVRTSGCQPECPMAEYPMH